MRCLKSLSQLSVLIGYYDMIVSINAKISNFNFQFQVKI